MASTFISISASDYSILYALVHITFAYMNFDTFSCPYVYIFSYVFCNRCCLICMYVVTCSSILEDNKESISQFKITYRRPSHVYFTFFSVSAIFEKLLSY